MKQRPLSISSFYGGKAKMSDFIVSKLDYENTDKFLTPYGGMCRVLLNKPRHSYEQYNDYGEGLTTLMSVLSNYNSARELIYYLSDISYCEDEFVRHKKIFDAVEDDFEASSRRLKKFLVDNGLCPLAMSRAQFDNFILENCRDLELNKNYTDGLKPLWDEYSERLIFIDKNGYLPRTRDINKELAKLSDVEVAAATYITFQMSRDGMGLHFSIGKSTDAFQRQVVNLFDCAERLEGIYVSQIDATNFFDWAVDDADLTDKETTILYANMHHWLVDPNAMIYADPSYIKPDDEEKLLENIDWENEPNLAEAIQRENKGKSPKDLGKQVYSMSYSYADQEQFVQAIADADSYVMISNYDLILYDKYLTPDKGWSKMEYQTTTSVGSKKGNERVEVLYYNY